MILAGDKVEILRKDIKGLNPSKGTHIKGTVTHVNGGYILVKPDGRKWETELYPEELRKL